MDKKSLRIVLVPSPDDSEEYQAQMRHFNDELQQGELNSSSVVWSLAAVGQDIDPYLEAFKVLLSGSFAAVNIALGGWIKEKYGRSVELEFGGVKVKAESVEELRELLAIAEEFQKRNEPKMIIS